MSFDFEDDVKPPKGCGKYDYFDWYDYDKVEKLNQTRSSQWITIFKKLKDAKEKGDENSLTKARAALRKHEAENKILKQKAEEAGHYWF